MNENDVGERVSSGGLSGLGLIMQLIGGVMSAIAGGYLAFIAVALLGRRGEMDDSQAQFVLWSSLVLLTSLNRSVAHSRLGAHLLYGGGRPPAAAQQTYLTAVAVQLGVVVTALVMNEAGIRWIGAVVLVLTSWPIALWLVARPMIERLGADGPTPADGGLDGASILMLVLGAAGIGVNALILIGVLKMPDEGASGLKLAMVFAIGLLSIRTTMQLRAGLRGARRADPAPTLAAAARYGNFGVPAGLLAGGGFAIALVDGMPDVPAAATMMVVTLVAMLTWMLLVWPTVIRRFARDRELRALAMREPLCGHAPDRGLPTLGWLLLALGVYSLATNLAAAALGVYGAPGSRTGGAEIAQLGAAFGTPGEMSKWLGVVIAALQVWAGYALIQLAPTYRVAATVYGVAAGAAALYTYRPLVDGLDDQGAAAIGDLSALVGLAMVSIALVLPVATLLFVRRPLPASQTGVEPVP